MAEARAGIDTVCLRLVVPESVHDAAEAAGLPWREEKFAEGGRVKTWYREPRLHQPAYLRVGNGRLRIDVSLPRWRDGTNLRLVAPGPEALGLVVQVQEAMEEVLGHRLESFTGAQVTRLDVACDWSVGNRMAVYLTDFQGRKWARMKRSAYPGQSVMVRAGERVYRAYDKGLESRERVAADVLRVEAQWRQGRGLCRVLGIPHAAGLPRTRGDLEMARAEAIRADRVLSAESVKAVLVRLWEDGGFSEEETVIQPEQLLALAITHRAEWREACRWLGFVMMHRAVGEARTKAYMGERTFYRVRAEVREADLGGLLDGSKPLEPVKVDWRPLLAAAEAVKGACA